MNTSIEQLIHRDNTPLDRHDDTSKSITTKLIEPYEYLQRLPGNNKTIRMSFIKAFNDLYFNIDNDQLIIGMNEVVDILHDCSLIIDDVEDSSEFRRGATTAHLKFGMPSTINCVNYMYFVAINKANKLAQMYSQDPQKQQEICLKVNQIIIDEMLNLHHGQGVDIYWRDNKKSIQLPTEDQYLEMVMDKTGGLLRIMVKLLLAFKPSKSSNHIALTSLVGMVYQLRDDYFNLTSDKYSHMKGIVGEDLIEGKFSFPILHSLHYSTESPVYDLLYNHDIDARKGLGDLIKLAIHYMENESRSLEYTNKKLKLCLELAETLIQEDKNVNDSDKSMIFKILSQLNDT